ncbi:DUF4932 domain-containing protein [uncultured Aquimarina sp.]|uniref:DUF4932 domain-containing protein n=1 Tax=uncultured Aquimarina sp. TaxID=575652 RepID=UPI002621516B|nr:DUF4932 domain-containing protein [uncultured Aquimarina sp.]
MKRIIFITLIMLSQKALADPSSYQSYQVTVNDITFVIDHKLELFNIIAIQAGHPKMSLSNIPYKEECIRYFKDVESNKAPEILFETFQKGWAIDDPISFLLYLDDKFQLKDGLDKGVIERGGGLKQLNKLASAMSTFAKANDYKIFFNDIKRPFYEQILQNSAYNFRDFTIIDNMEAYFGQKKNSYNILLNLTGGYGNFGKSITRNTKTDLYAIIETNTHSGSLPTYNPSIGLTELIIHEFNHGFINPIFDQYITEVQKSEHLYEPIKSSMQQQGYWDWRVTVNEHIVRAAVVEITKTYYDNELSEHLFYKLLKVRRFIYTDLILGALDDYTQNREKYLNFDQFMPTLLEVFNKIPETYITEKQNEVEAIRHTNIPEVPKPYEFAKDSTTYFIVSSKEDDALLQQKMIDWVDSYRKMFSDKIQLITDKEALKKDLSNSDIVLFGTPSGNLMLQKHLSNLPVVIKENFIITNRQIKAKDLQLVTSWVNPYNPKKTMSIYTAQQVEHIVNFNFSPSKDNFHYWVAKNLVCLDKGNFESYGRLWRPNLY